MDSRSLTRRDLLRRSAAAAGAFAIPTILSSGALGDDGTPAASERIRLGFIGVGNQGNGNLSPHLKDTVAVCDVDQTRLMAAKARVEKASGGTCQAYGDYRKLLENKDVDAVVVTTPDHWHALITIHACEAGKDVYCEKPLTLKIAEGQAMVRAARANKRIVQTGSQQRSDANFRLACELVRNGRLGAIKTVKVGIAENNFMLPAVPDSAPPPELNYDMWLGPAPLKPYNQKHVHYNFRFFWDYSGGQMTNWGAHHLDIAQWGLGMDESGPVSAEAQAKYAPEAPYEVPDWVMVTYRYASGVTMLCSQDFPMGTTFEGEKGTLFVTRGKIMSNPPELLIEPLKETDLRLYASTSHHGNWLQCIKSRGVPIADVAIGHRSATVCHLGNLAIRSGREVTWDPEKEEVVGDKEQAAMLRYPYREPWKLFGF